MTSENNKSLEQKTKKEFVRGFGKGMYLGVGRFGALLYALFSSKEFIDNFKESIQESTDIKNSLSYRRGYLSGNVIGYSLALTAGAMLSGASLVLLNRYLNQ